MPPLLPSPATPAACPCGSAAAYDACCGPLVRNEQQASGPEQLMRSRYTAYSVGGTDHLFRTWHPATRPELIAPDDDLAWTRLEILDVVEEADGDPGAGIVEFRAHWAWHGQTGALHERSRFTRRAGRWVYLDGETP
ncbi:MAG TPA: YchJ family metal-binding protein [Marmoricola sp.]|jgi:SEC-C motif-containing protein|nr:YchJ family metal-binding protein [Marmoricola sp.]